MSDSEKERETEQPSVTSSIPALLTDDGESQSSDTLYKYRDFSHVGEDDDTEVAAENPPPTPATRGNSESSIRVQKFPVKLYVILAQKEFHDIIAWMPHGRSWKVLKPSLFESMVMPLFFEYSNYHSFNRLVNAWSFRRISSGPDRGSYYHELFLRGMPHLQKYMRRLPKTHKKLPMSKKDEPDFYALEKSNPLPALEDAPIPGLMPHQRQQQQQQQQLQSQQQAPGMTGFQQLQQSEPPMMYQQNAQVVTPPGGRGHMGGQGAPMQQMNPCMMPRYMYEQQGQEEYYEPVMQPMNGMAPAMQMGGMGMHPASAMTLPNQGMQQQQPMGGGYGGYPPRGPVRPTAMRPQPMMQPSHSMSPMDPQMQQMQPQPMYEAAPAPYYQQMTYAPAPTFMAPAGYEIAPMGNERAMMAPPQGAVQGDPNMMMQQRPQARQQFVGAE